MSGTLVSKKKKAHNKAERGMCGLVNMQDFVDFKGFWSLAPKQWEPFEVFTHNTSDTK